MANDGVVEDRLIRVLGGWAVASLVTGAALSRRPATRACGRETATWGAMSAAGTLLAAWRRAAKGPTEPHRLRRRLLLNAGLDAVSLAVGAARLRARGLRGDGLAHLVQSAFLLVVDSLAVRALRR